MKAILLILPLILLAACGEPYDKNQKGKFSFSKYYNAKESAYHIEEIRDLLKEIRDELNERKK